MSESKSPYEQDDYFRFAFVADEWFTEYAFQSGGVISPPVLMFSFAMTLELYLKAYYSKLSGGGIAATKLSHNIDKLLRELESMDSDFPDILKFNVSLIGHPIHELDRSGWNTVWYNNLSEEEKNSLKENYEFYLAMAYGPDLKYGISPSLQKHNGRIISSAWTSFNQRLIDIIVYIRNRIGYPLRQSEDILLLALKNSRQSVDSIEYIKRIISQTNYI